MLNKKRLKDLSTFADSKLIEEIKYRNANRKELRTYKRLALEILLKLDEKRMTQKQLAEKLGVSAQYVNKLVKGNEKFGGEILVKLEEVLDMPIFVQNLPREKQELLKEEKLEPVFTGKMAVIIPIFQPKISSDFRKNSEQVFSDSAMQKSAYASCAY